MGMKEWQRGMSSLEAKVRNGKQKVGSVKLWNEGIWRNVESYRPSLYPEAIYIWGMSCDLERPLADQHCIDHRQDR